VKTEIWLMKRTPSIPPPTLLLSFLTFSTNSKCTSRLFSRISVMRI
jgi:hypothetical protein